MRIIIKGGVWKNTEDEILKAAVMKYGKNQWARISSLLTRKTAKACKARWYEWLDPSIKKTEWSKEEDERLLQLAKLMPTQWRTIAPIVGRTPSQCLERYQRLLDEAEAKGGELGLTGPEGPETSAPTADDVRRLRPGEIDPDPEAKPARPDPVDMDEDEKEMLSEARARLANTQGKKAKRKARERQLEEARRLASLQKKRELKAAGIELKTKRKKKGIDYNADIPFEKRPAPGFYDTTEEREKAVTLKGLTNVHLSKLDGKRRVDIEQEERKKDVKRQKLRKEKEGDGDIQFVAEGTRKANIAKAAEQEQITRRKRLVLPAPQVGEEELEQIVKIGMAGEEAKSLMEEDGNDVTKSLLGSYTPATASMAARTPRTPAQADNIMLEARNLLAQTRTQTPLMGQENTPMHENTGFGFEGITPRRSVQQTPNPLLTPLHGSSGGALGGGATPRAGSATPAATPLRDEFSVNRGYDNGELTPRDERLRAAAAKRQLAMGFSSLPKPANDFEIAAPKIAADGDEEAQSGLMDEDAGDRDRRTKAAKAATEQARLARRSQAIQRSLPRPLSVNSSALLEQTESDVILDDSLAKADALVREEIVRVLRHDAARYPVPKAPRAPQDVDAIETEFEDSQIALARDAVRNELEQMGINDEVIRTRIVDGEDERICDELNEHLIYSPEGKLILEAKGDKNDEKKKIEEMEFVFTTLRNTMIQESQRLGKVEKRLNITMGGYVVRSRTLSKRLLDSYTELEQSRIELESFRKLREQESVGGSRRVASLQSQVEKLRGRQWELSNRYQELVSEKARIQERVDALIKNDELVIGNGVEDEDEGPQAMEVDQE